MKFVKAKYQVLKGPYFPVLKQYETNENVNAVKCCQICAINLLGQWDCHQKEKGPGEPTKRNFNIKQFKCFKCLNVFLREEISLEQDISEKVRQGALLANDQIEYVLMCK